MRERYDIATNAAIVKKMAQFGNWLREIRLSHKLTQAEFIEKLEPGSYPGPLSKLEKGTRSISFARMIAYARACGYDLQLSFAPIKEEQEDYLPEFRRIAVNRTETVEKGKEVNKIVKPEVKVEVVVEEDIPEN